MIGDTATDLRQFILRPVQAWLARDENDDLGLTFNERIRRDLYPKWATDGQPSQLLWRGYQELPIDAAGAAQCLWEFIDLSLDLEALLLPFVERWGLLHWNHTREQDLDQWEDLLDWESASSAADFILRVMATTLEGEVLPLDAFDDYWLPGEGSNYLEEVLSLIHI